MPTLHGWILGVNRDCNVCFIRQHDKKDLLYVVFKVLPLVEAGGHLWLFRVQGQSVGTQSHPHPPKTEYVFAIKVLFLQWENYICILNL